MCRMLRTHGFEDVQRGLLDYERIRKASLKKTAMVASVSLISTYLFLWGILLIRLTHMDAAKEAYASEIVLTNFKRLILLSVAGSIVFFLLNGFVGYMR
jgi:hypothetical protein